VRAPEIARHQEGLYAWAISDSEVKRLLRLLWPSYVASRQHLADRLYGGTQSAYPRAGAMHSKQRWIVKHGHAGNLRVGARNGNRSAGSPRSCAADGCRPSRGGSLNGRSTISVWGRSMPNVMKGIKLVPFALCWALSPTYGTVEWSAFSIC
jgi:hypothetical protein